MDGLTIERYGLQGGKLMENAGFQIASFIQSELERRSVTVFAGAGNNGGDALVTARRLDNWGFNVHVVVADEGPGGLTGEELDTVKAMGIKVLTPKEELPDPVIAVDGLLGYSIDGDPRPPYDRLVERVNDADTVVAVDVPTGVDPDTGEPMDPSVDPDHIVTLGAPFEGLEKFRGITWVADISIPSAVYRDMGLQRDIFWEESLIEWV